MLLAHPTHTRTHALTPTLLDVAARMPDLSPLEMRQPTAVSYCIYESPPQQQKHYLWEGCVDKTQPIILLWAKFLSKRYREGSILL